MLKYVRILSVSDIHSPRYLNLFIASISRANVKDVDLVVLAGDLIDRGRVEWLKPVVEVLQRLRNNIPIVAVFGNEEYMDREKEIIEKYNSIQWINDDLSIVNVRDIDICIVGSRGVLQKPTQWQLKHIPNIHRIYSERLQKIKALLHECRSRQFYTILVTHYASSFHTIKGEPASIYSYLGYPIIEHLQPDERPNIAIHGHAHNAKVLEAVVNNVMVYNVALPARRDVSILTIAVDV